jgi:quinol monooxygenase YgiN
LNGLIIHFEVAEGREADFERAITTVADLVKATDPQYEYYTLARLRDERTRYVVIERFADWSAFDAHMNDPVIGAATGAITECLAGEPTLEWLDYVN